MSEENKDQAQGDLRPQLTINPQEEGLLMMHRNYSSAVIADVHNFLGGAQECAGDKERLEMYLKGLVSTRVYDQHFGGLLITVAAPMMIQEEKELLKQLVETMYARVVQKIAYDIVQGAKAVELEDPTPKIHVPENTLRLVDENGEATGSVNLNGVNVQ